MSSETPFSPLSIGGDDSMAQPLLSSPSSQEDGAQPITKFDPVAVRRFAAIGVCVFLAFPIFSAGILGASPSNPHPDSRLVTRTSSGPDSRETYLKRKKEFIAKNTKGFWREGSDSDTELEITILGDPVNVWASPESLHRCHQVDVPDIPTRAFMESGNNKQIHMIQGSTEFHIMTGPSLLDVTRQCDIAFNKTANPDPSQFAANEFLDSPVAFANGTVVAIAHTEFPGDRYNLCPPPLKHYPHCWTVTMGLMISHDFGRTWQHAKPPPHHLVAAVPYAYNASQLAYGWGDPTNILQHPTDGHYYMAAWNRNDVGLQEAGVCMMRTSSLLDPSSWRAWNGKEFGVSLVSPYEGQVNPKDHICTVLDVDTKLLDPTQCNPFGLVWSPSLQLFVMTWGCLSGYGPFYLTTSEDLIHWSAPQHLYDKGMLPDDVGKNVTSMHYPNFMDVAAPDRYGDNNFNTIGPTPHLFWVSFGHNVYADGRSAWATPLHIAKKDRKRGDDRKTAVA